MPPEDIMRFPQITEAIECEFEGKRAFVCTNLDEAVSHCVRKAVQYGGSSSLTLTIGFKSEGQGKMLLAASLATKTPSPATLPIHVYVDREARLRSEDPYQVTIDFPRPAEGSEGGNS